MNTSPTFANIVTFVAACAITIIAPPVGFWHSALIFIGAVASTNFIIDLVQK